MVYYSPALGMGAMVQVQSTCRVLGRKRYTYHNVEGKLRMWQMCRGTKTHKDGQNPDQESQENLTSHSPKRKRERGRKENKEAEERGRGQTGCIPYLDSVSC
jgi:hypothetical protein